MEFNRGDIVIVNLYPKKGDEVGKIRPAVIISGNDENSILDTVILLPLSTDLLDDMFPYMSNEVLNWAVKFWKKLLFET